MNLRLRQLVSAAMAGLLLCVLLGASEMVTDAGAAGAPVLSVSLSHSPATMPRTDELVTYSAEVADTGDEPTVGEVVLQIELPSGAETRAISAGGVGWGCVRQEPEGARTASVTCTRSDELAAGSSYPPVAVTTALGADAPQSPLATAKVSGGGAVGVASVEDAFTFEAGVPFGIVPGSFTTEVLNARGGNETQAGGHPFTAGTAFAFNAHIAPDGSTHSVGSVRDLGVELPPGFVGNPQAVPQRCPTLEDVVKNLALKPTCPAGSIVGSVTLHAGSGQNEAVYENLPVYALPPERGTPAQFAFAIAGTEAAYTLTARLRPDEGYAISVVAAPVLKKPELRSVAVTFCSYGTRTGGFFGVVVEGCRKPGETGANPEPFLTDPTQCAATPPVTTLSVDSWQEPGDVKSYQATSPQVIGCDRVPFGPRTEIAPSSGEAASPTGLNVDISMPTDGLESVGEIAQGNLKRAVVTLPQGMTVNPGAADGLAACASGQIKLGTNDPVECPQASKIGSAEITTPLLEDKLEGSVYLAKQGDNPFGSLLALYLVVESAERGILVKIPGKVTPDPTTGQITATFDNNPQLPFSSVVLRFNEGNRAALLNPPACGSYGIESALSPWSASNPDAPSAAETASTTSTFAVDRGPAGGACPQGRLEPTMNAGLLNPVAATTSPFGLSVARPDGSRYLQGLDVTLPPGLTAYLKGVPYCPDAALASISEAEGTGQGQIDTPACPAASQIGTVSVGVGGGTNPYYVNTGSAYLAGPYKGAPLSIAIVAPAVAGPFDLGTVVVRSAAFVNQETAQITIKSDPIPTMLHGIPLDVRDIRVNIDRPSFTVAPTNCEAMAIDAQVQGDGDVSASVSNHFQVADCAALPFSPKLALRVFGKTNRNAKPRLRAVLTQPAGQANIRRAQVNLPHSLFLEQNHIKTVCTRVQWAEGDGNGSACPAGSVYGHAKAWTPLLDKPLDGKVYLRSNGGERKLPDLVAALDGQVDVALWGKVDSGPNHGLRNTFEVVPDAPVSKFILEMAGGRKGLLVNSEPLCSKKAKRQAIVRFVAQSGKVKSFKPKVTAQCKKKHGKGKKHGRHGSKKRHRGS